MWHNLVNTQYFKEAAIDFRRNGGRYTKAPRGSKEYIEYWKLHEERCMKGYKVGNVWVSGRHYFHLNFQPMWKVPDNVALKALEESRDGKGNISKRTADKIFDFPRFNEMQYEWWRFKHIAWHGGTFMGIQSPGGKHLCCAKTRGAGFSYMEAADGVYNFNFIPGSKSYYFASLEEYLIKDGILNKVQEGLDWINSYCPYWKQNRQKKNTLLHQRASYLDKYGEEQGTLAEIMGVTVENPNKTRGKRGKKIVFEEGGSFKNLSAALEICLGSMRDGDFYVGQVSVFGTGGEEGPSIEGLESVFTQPHQWNMLAFPNIWEDGDLSEVGYFVPSFRANFKYTDADGNIDYQLALDSDNKEREIKSQAKDPKDLDRRKAEYPQKPSELFQRLHKNDFNVSEIDKQIRRLESDNTLKQLIRHGEFVSSDTAKGGVEFVIKADARPIVQYPHKQKDDLTGCVSICERPVRDQQGNVPPGIYKVVFDAFYKDDAEDLTSLFDIRVFKLENKFSKSYVNLPVAWFTGRRKLSACYELLFNFCRYYNATAQGENSGGGQGVIDYAKGKRLLQWLDYEPEMLHNKEYASNMKNRAFLMNMSTDRKKLGMAYLVEWHMDVRGYNTNGAPVYNIHQIYDLGLLRELRKGGLTNSDRMSSCLIAMFMLKENIALQIQEIQQTSNFFSRSLFGESTSSEAESGIVSLY
ncbi:MAG: hypothetical protein EKK63_02365 [Acinetobacter sp.]|uniref:hypothetical protein n=1 Tax=Acinetobacter sp. TaxID=472 RepID=UPI000FB37109|nr:hypothetical protein [Acinetobacter sp.]RUP42161.1 MAG: hypothetical protein EKK63_02365 [Acinetobacter sp.]